MTMKNTIAFTPAARAQLKKIALHTQQRWGRQQRDRYLAQLYARCAVLATQPQHGKPRDEILPGLRSASEGSHIIYYLKTADGVAIVGVLHRRMEAEFDFE
jgi:toxin ParE1/3/4